MALRKLKVVGITVGLVLVAVNAAAAEKPAPRGKRLDLHGDPLPKGAALRLGTIQCRTGMVDHLAVGADGKSILGVRWANRREKNVPTTYLSIWDVATGALRQTRELSEEFSLYNAVSSDGRRILTQGDGLNQLTVWDVAAEKPIRTLAEKEGWLYCGVFSPDGKQVASVLQRGQEFTVLVWSLATGKRSFARKIDNQVFGNQLIFSPAGKHLLVPLTAHEGGMRCLDIPSGRLLWENKQLGSYSLVMTPDGKILSAQPRGSVVDLATGRPIPFKQMPRLGWSNRLTLTPDGRTLLVADANGVRDVVVWDLVRGKAVRRLPRAGDLVVVAPDGKSVVTSNGALQRWDLATGKPLFPDTFSWGHAREVIALAFSADGTRLASASWDGTVRLWDTRTGRPLRVWSGHRGWNPINDRGHWLQDWAGAEAVDITPDGRYLLSGGGEESLRLWDATTDKEVQSIALPQRDADVPERCFHCLRISPDGSRGIAVFGSRYGILSSFGSHITNHLAVWNLKTGDLLGSHRLKGAGASNSAISPNGRTLLMDGVVVDVASGKEIGRLKGGERGLSCAFSRDGALAIGGSTREEKNNPFAPDGVRIWEIATGKTVAHLKTKSWIAQVRFHPDNRFVAVNGEDDIRMWDVWRGKVVAHRKKQEPMRGSEPLDRYGSCLAFAPDGRRLATGHRDSTILLWDISLPVSSPEPLTAKDLESLWADLADPDAAKAWRTVWRLSTSAHEALALLRSRVKPVPVVAPERLRTLVVDLDSDSFAIRQAAVKRLKELGLQAEPALRAALKARPSLEQKKRIEELLADFAKAPSPPTPQELRQLRALIVLERIGTPEARRLLEAAAKGPESARLTRQAQAALACLP